MIIAFVPDLMDRSKVAAAAADVRFVSDPGTLAKAMTGDDVAVVDLSRPGTTDVVRILAAAGHRLIAFTNHTDRDSLAAARAAGVEAMPRSEFFSRVAELLAP